MAKPLTVWITINGGKFSKRWEYQTTSPASWEICMQVRKQQLDLDMEQQTGSKSGKEYVKAVYCHPAYLTYMQRIPGMAEPGGLPSMGLHRVGHDWNDDWNDLAAAAEFIMRNAGLEKTQAGIKIAGRNINHLRYADDTTLMAKSEEELKCLLFEVKEESVKVGLKLNIQKTKIMVSGPITSRQIDWETVETVADFIFQGSKITAEGDGSHEIKRRLLLGRKVMTNLDSILKSIDITLSTKVRLVKAMVFPVVMHGCESGPWRKLSTEELMLLNCGIEKTLESPLDRKDIQSVHPQGNQSWMFIGRADVEA